MEQGRVEGISIGELNGVKSVLLELLRLSFDPLPKDISAGVGQIGNSDILRKLTLMAYQIKSVEEFRGILQETGK